MSVAFQSGTLAKGLPTQTDQAPGASEGSHNNAAEPVEAAISIGADSTALGVERLRDIFFCVGDAAYEWDIKKDKLTWGENAIQTLGVGSLDDVSTSRRFAALLDTENLTSRYDAIMNTAQVDEGEGVPFQVVYRILTNGRDQQDGCWLEDTGRWFVGGDGVPERAFGVVRRIDERQEREQRLAHLSYYDPLTGDLNRTRLTEALGQVITNNEVNKQNFTFMLAAIDNLAMINDAFGFDVADQVIAAVSKRLKSRMRGGDTIGRYAGNKFGLILLECGEDDMEVAATRLLDAVRQTVIDTAVGPVAATVSIGGVAMPKHAREVQQCLTRAEEVLEKAKSRHLEGFVAYEYSERRDSIRKRNIMFADEIVTALNDRRLNIAYQPIVDAQSGEAVLHECLLRMTKLDGTTVSAGHFIPVAEQIGLVRMIDHRVFELVLGALTEHPNLNLTFNVSGVTANDPEWLANFTANMRAHLSLAERMTVEITETAAIQDVAQTVSFVNTVRDLGCKVAIDDFGAGYTSFQNLKLLEVDMVKIDGAFVDKLHESPDNQFFVKTLIDLAKNFDIKTVAEWVCDERDVSLLREMGVDYMQGFLYGAANLEVPGEVSTSDVPSVQVTAG